MDVKKDHPDNIVAKVVGHKLHNQQLYMMVRWKGFTTELDQYLLATELADCAADQVTDYLKRGSTVQDDHLRTFTDEYFPTLHAEAAVEAASREDGAIVAGRRHARGRKGRTLADERNRARTSKKAKNKKKKSVKKKKIVQKEKSTMSEGGRRAEAATATTSVQQGHSDTSLIGTEGGGDESGPWDGQPSTKQQKAKSGYALRTIVKESSITGAGLGLVLQEDAKAGDRVAIYSGDMMTAVQMQASASMYMMCVNANTYLDGKNTSHAAGRYINDGGKSGVTNNCKFAARTYANYDEAKGRFWISVVANRNIAAGTELFVAYGARYKWPPNMTFQKPRVTHRQAPAINKEKPRTTKENVKRTTLTRAQRRDKWNERRGHDGNIDASTKQKASEEGCNISSPTNDNNKINDDSCKDANNEGNNSGERRVGENESTCDKGSGTDDTSDHEMASSSESASSSAKRNRGTSEHDSSRDNTINNNNTVDYRSNNPNNDNNTIEGSECSAANTNEVDVEEQQDDVGNNKQDDDSTSTAEGSSDKLIKHQFSNVPYDGEEESTVRHKVADLLQVSDTVIVHQTNCVSTKPMGLAAQIFDKYPHANTYKHRQQHERPGTTVICGNNKDQRLVANMNAQVYPGGPGRTGKDKRADRRRYFHQCLHALGLYISTRLKHPAQVTFPRNIGCGMAKGQWEVYREAIVEWARTAATTDGHPVVISICTPPWEADASAEHDSDDYDTCEEFTEDDDENIFG